MKIAMIGLGAVALADALALGRTHNVVMTGPVPDRVDAINAGQYHLSDPHLAPYLSAHSVSLQATLDTRAALDGAQMVFVSAPLSLDPDTGHLRTIELESRIELATRLLPQVPIVIRSAVPIGFTDTWRNRLSGAKLVYAPEFSRHGAALSDILYPSFLVVGECGNLGAQVGQVLLSAALLQNVPVRHMPPTEAEALRHLSVLCQEVQGASPVSPELGNLARPLSRMSERNDPERAQDHASRLAYLADYLVSSRARQIGYYLTPAASKAQGKLALVKSSLEAFGLKTHVRTDADSALTVFKRGCDVVVAQRVTADLLDIREKVLVRDHFAP